jgi:hypothetical protein
LQTIDFQITSLKVRIARRTLAETEEGQKLLKTLFETEKEQIDIIMNEPTQQALKSNNETTQTNIKEERKQSENVQQPQQQQEIVS